MERSRLLAVFCAIIGEPIVRVVLAADTFIAAASRVVVRLTRRVTHHQEA